MATGIASIATAAGRKRSRFSDDAVPAVTQTLSGVESGAHTHDPARDLAAHTVKRHHAQEYEEGEDGYFLGTMPMSANGPAASVGSASASHEPGGGGVQRPTSANDAKLEEGEEEEGELNTSEPNKQPPAPLRQSVPVKVSSSAKAAVADVLRQSLQQNLASARPVATSDAPVSTSAPSVAASAPPAAAGPVEDEAQRKRREKLAAWKAKHSAGPAVAAASSASAGSSSSHSPSAAPAPAPAAVAPPAKQPPISLGLKKGFGISTGGLKLKVPMKVGGGAGTAAASSTAAKPKPAIGYGDDDDDIEAGAGRAGAGRRHPPFVSLETDDDQRIDGGGGAAPIDYRPAAASSSSATASTLAPAASSSPPDGEDDLDSFMSSLGDEAHSIAKAAAASARAPMVATLDDIMSVADGGGDESGFGDAAAPSSSTAVGHPDQPSAADTARIGHSTVPAPQLSSQTDDEEERYHRMFIESLRNGSGTVLPNDRADAPPAVPVASQPATVSAQQQPSPPVDQSDAGSTSRGSDNGTDAGGTGVASSVVSKIKGSGITSSLAASLLRGRKSGLVSAAVAAVASSLPSTASSGSGSAGAGSSSANAAADASSGVDGGGAVDEESLLYTGEEWGEERSALDIIRDKMAKKEIKAVDHAAVDYAPFRKDFYIEPKEIAAMSQVDVENLRADLEIKVRGKNVPRPIATWEQAGLPDKVLQGLDGRSFTAPFAIQRQALPVIMSGRDVIGVARTGSGKTLAYLLPIFRQVLDQPPLEEGEGPIALVMAPARELVVQIYHEARKLAKPLGLRVTAVYGGAPVADQIGDLKRGSEIVICTPGRMIDLLTLNAGKLISFQRVTYVVMDEADRMFDMGFEPQITRIMSLVRPDRQVVMFSATFPSHVEALAKKVLKSPVEVVVGGRSKASPDIAQFVEVRDEAAGESSGMGVAGSDKFRRLLQLLGEWYEQGSILIFVDTKEHCDALFTDLYKAGYVALTLHGGKDQADRDQTLADFKAGVRTLMIATSVAGRGLDVKNLVLVINYSAPNHLEDYVHRVGRTGRAGNKGTAFTFIAPHEAAFAQDLIRALKDARQEDHVPKELIAMAEEHKRKVEAGEAKKRHSGYSSAKGFKFDESELSTAQAQRKVQKQAYEVEAGITTISEILAEEEEKAESKETEARLAAEAGDGGAIGDGAAPADAGSTSPGRAAGSGGAQQASSAASAIPVGPPPDEATIAMLRAKAETAKRAAAMGLGAKEDADAAQKMLEDAERAVNAAASAANPAASVEARKAAAAAAAAIQKQLSAAGIAVGAPSSSAAGSDSLEGRGAGKVSDELEVNDYPQQARWKLMKEGVRRIEEWTGAALTSKGVFVQAGRAPPAGERKLYLLIEGPSEMVVRKAKTEARRILEEETLRVGMHAAQGQYGKFTV